MLFPLLLGSNAGGLAGSENDAKIWGDIFSTYSKLYPKDYETPVILTGTLTRAKIAHAVKLIHEKCKPGDILFFFYSGHGYTRGSVDLEEKGADEYIPLSDGPLLDHELVPLLKHPTVKMQYVCTLDCCHSGGFDDILRAQSNDWLLIASCAEHQLAQESFVRTKELGWPPGPSVVCGAFTGNFRQALLHISQQVNKETVSIQDMECHTHKDDVWELMKWMNQEYVIRGNKNISLFKDLIP